ncbi:MAG TPA: tannase/feruloyl esterase family alpha/beta hydrolase [Terracidiphilus sp.]|nr:tannase/feruloyl esterase family alpha/beta hydrolase [Terracidiphilus sp.]
MRIYRFLLASTLPLFAVALMRGQTSAVPPAASAVHAAGDACAKLSDLQIPNATITSAKSYQAGTFPPQPSPYGGPDMAEFYKKLPAFCRVMAVAKPSADSNIVIDVWMPLAGWNGKLQGTGNGGFAGSYDIADLATLMSKGYAAAATDTGHQASFIDAKWALGHPEKVIDFGYRGIHEMTRVAKIVVQQFYSAPASHSYFASCSDGGREALMEAERYPADYDGILAGAPANYWTLLVTVGVTDTQALTATPASYIPQSKLPAIAHAVLAQCDQLDGVKDGILNDPRQCKFDPATIECKSGENTDQCLTSAQVATLKTIYAGVRDAQGHTLFPGYLPGAEEGRNGWGPWILGPAPAHSLMASFGSGYYSNMVYEKADWDYRSFSLESGLALAQKKTANALDAVDPNLTPFNAHGGKLIIYHGWNDPAIPALNSVNYYRSVSSSIGEAKTESFVRLYMAPGMQHCAGGPGPDSFGQSSDWNPDPKYNMRTALELWVEKGIAPAEIIATKTEENPNGKPLMTRPLCPFPQIARYKGTGDTNAAENFVCATEK